MFDIDHYNDHPYLYRDLRTLGNNIVDTCLEEGSYDLLRWMYLTPQQICTLYNDDRICDLRHLSEWDVPMQGTNIFALILILNTDANTQISEIQHLLATGYVPTQQDVARYMSLRTDTFAYHLIGLVKHELKVKDVLCGNRYLNWRRAYSESFGLPTTASWNTLHELWEKNDNSFPNIWNHGTSINSTTVLGNSISTISPNYLVEIREGQDYVGHRYLFEFGELYGRNKNPYTGNSYSQDVKKALNQRRDYLMLRGFPFQIPDLDEPYNMGQKLEYDILKERLQISDDYLKSGIVSLLIWKHNKVPDRSDLSVLFYINSLLDIGDIESDMIILLIATSPLGVAYAMMDEPYLL